MPVIFGLLQDMSVALEIMMQDVQRVSYMLMAVQYCTEWAAWTWDNLNFPSYALASDSKYRRKRYWKIVRAGDTVSQRECRISRTLFVLDCF